MRCSRASLLEKDDSSFRETWVTQWGLLPRAQNARRSRIGWAGGHGRIIPPLRGRIRHGLSGARDGAAGMHEAQIATWLNRLGLGEYAEPFARNGIDLSVLADLTEYDLERLGVLLGHRRKMLRAIGELSGSAVAKPSRQDE